MPVNNKYIYRSQISEAKLKQFLKLFYLDLTATQIAELTHLSRDTVYKYLKVIHQGIADFCKAEFPFSGQVEVDKSYSVARGAKGKPGRGVRGKTSHINGINGFWGFAKTRLVKCQGMHPSKFYVHLKESEFRFNYRKEDIYLNC